VDERQSAVTSTTTGYSGTPLPKKLGLKDGQHVPTGKPIRRSTFYAALVLLGSAVVDVSSPALAQQMLESDLIGCWEEPLTKDDTATVVVCFDTPNAVSTLWTGIDEGIGSEGTFELIDGRLHLHRSERALADGWTFSGAGRDAFSCALTIKDRRLALQDCSNGVSEGQYQRAATDPMLGNLPFGSLAPTPDLATSIRGCWAHYAPASGVDITVLCFDGDRDLTSRTIRGRDEKDTEDVTVPATFKFSADRLSMVGRFDEDISAIDCRIVLAPNVDIMRLGECISTRQDGGQEPMTHVRTFRRVDTQ
jgi:hypothetical protein